MEEKIAALYLRLSDEDKNGKTDESNSILAQRELLKTYVAGRKELAEYKLMEFCDDGYSGTDFERPQMQKLLELVKQRAISCILVKDLSRFGRNYIEVGNYLEQVFPFLGIRFIAVNDGYDSGVSGTASEFMDTAFKNLVYDLYSKDLSEKIISVRRIRAGQGKFVTAFAPYGYKKSKEQKLEADSETKPIVRRIFEMAAEGIPKIQIARILNQEGVPSPGTLRKRRGENFHKEQAGETSVWSGSAISHILRDQRYVGDAVYGRVKPASVGSRKDKMVPREEWIIVPDNHEPLVSRELFEKVNRMFRKYSRRQEREQRPFAGKVRCGSCKHRISRKHDRYRCQMPEVTEEYGCYRGAVKEEELGEAVLSVLQRLGELYGETKAGKETELAGKEQIRRLENELGQCEMEIRSVKGMRHGKYEEYKNGGISKEQFIKEKKVLDIREERLAVEKGRMERKLREVKTGEVGGRRLRTFLTSQTLTRRLAEVFVRQVVILADGSVRIEWDFEDIWGGCK